MTTTDPLAMSDDELRAYARSGGDLAAVFHERGGSGADSREEARLVLDTLARILNTGHRAA